MTILLRDKTKPYPYLWHITGFCGLHSCNIKEDKINTGTADIPNQDSTEGLKTIPPVGDAEGFVESRQDHYVGRGGKLAVTISGTCQRKESRLDLDSTLFIAWNCTNNVSW